MYETSNIILLFITISTLTSSPPPYATADEALIDQACRNTTDYAFCHAIVYADTYPLNDRYVLNSIAHTEIYFNATNTKKYIDSKLKALKSSTNGGDTQVIAGLKKCKEHYEEAIQTIDSQGRNINDDAFGFLIEDAVDIDHSVRKCIKSITRGRELMHKRNEDMLKLANICLVAAELYPHAGN